MKKKITLKALMCLMLAIIMTVCTAACAKAPDTPASPVSKTGSSDGGNYDIPLSENLMSGFKAEAVANKKADGRFLTSQFNFGVELFKESTLESKESKKNILISPLSVMLALAMTANGADGKTLREMENVLGGELNIDELNEYLHSYIEALPSTDGSKFSIADSIWFRDEEDRISVNKSFLQTNANYYDAQAYKLPFDDAALEKINSWVNEHTDGMIKKIIERIDGSTVMYLINALAFDAEWQRIYTTDNIRKSEFTNIDGEKQDAELMYSEESVYLNDGNAQGFMRPYKDNHYSFAALLPNEGVDLYDYIASLTGEGLQNTLKTAKPEQVQAAIPKFTYDYSIFMNSALSKLGINEAFNENAADFSKLGKSENGNIYISDVIHKTFIAVDEKGTKAGAVTAVIVKDNAIAIIDHMIYLNRPFVYMIIDNETKLPAFIGAVTNLNPAE